MNLEKLSVSFVVFSIVSCIWSSVCWGQQLSPDSFISQYVHKTFTDDERLHNVLDIVQDNDGFLWLATYSGLVRFDSKEFVHYNRSTRKDFPASSVRSLLKDRAGRLWIGTNDAGLFLYQKDTFQQVDAKGALPSESIRKIFEDDSGRIWIGTSSGLACFQDGQFKQFSSFASIGRKLINFICQDSSGTLFIGTNQLDGVYLLEKNAAEFVKCRGELSAVAQKSIIESMVRDEDSLWAATSSMLIHIRGAKVLDSFDLNQAGGFTNKISINRIYTGSGGLLWLTGDSGLVRFSKGQFDFFFSDNGLSDDIAFAACQDKEGSLWVGTRAGLDQFSEAKFINYGRAEGLLDDTVNAVLEDQPGEFLIASNRGLNRVVPSQRRVEAFTEELLQIRIRHLYKDSRGRVWVSTYGNGLIVLKDRKIAQHVTAADGLAADKVRLVLEDRQHNIWVGTQSGLSRIDHSGRIVNYNTKNSKGLTNNFILSLNEDAQGRIWIGTDGGGVHIYANGLITKSKENISGNVIFRFLFDKNGIIWVGTDNGLSIIDQNISYNLNAADSLPSDTVFDLKEDNEGKIWLISDVGIYCASKKALLQLAEQKDIRLKITLFDRYSGLKDNPTANALTETDSKGNFWLPTYQGVSLINPEQIPVNTTTPKTIILDSNISKFGTVSKDGAYSIPPETRRVKFHFAVLSFISPEKNLLQFKLEGFDKQWSDPSGARDVSYTNLFPGSYTFRVRGMNNDGVPSPHDAVLYFYKQPHYYETIWFKLLSFSFLSGVIIFLAAKRYQYRLKKLNEELEQRRIQLVLERKATEAERIAKEHEAKLSAAYSRFVPHIFLNFLGKESILDVRLGDQTEEELSVLFADIRDFTTISEKHSPKETFDFINSYLGQMGPVVYKYGGFIDKYIGDAIMALFPSAPQAVKAAVAMNTLLLSDNCQQRIKNHQQRRIRIGIGINTGKLMLGTVGEEHRMDGTVISDAVNLASRIEGLTKYYGADILLSEETFLSLPEEDKQFVRMIDRVLVKGKETPVTLFEVFASLPDQLRLVKEEAKPMLAEAIALYSKGELAHAKKIFQECLARCPADTICSIYITRCDAYLQAGTGKNWRPVHDLSAA